jgi:hypothetical protein
VFSCLKPTTNFSKKFNEFFHGLNLLNILVVKEGNQGKQHEINLRINVSNFFTLKLRGQSYWQVHTKASGHGDV